MADPPPSSVADGEAQPKAEPDTLFPNLPNDVAVQCLARVPRSHHPNLSLVCKSWLSLLRSPLFYSIRRSLSASDFSLYINLRLPSSPFPSSSFKWFLLHHPQFQSPNPNPNPLALSLPSPPSSQPIGASIVSLSSKIYLIGGSIDEFPTSTMWILDSISNKWEPGPEMRVAREFAAAGAIDGKIYVLGGCPVNSRARVVNWAEVYDPEARSWSPVPSPEEGVKEGLNLMHASAVLGGKMYAMADRGGIVYDPGAGEWGPVPKRLDMGWRGRAAVVGEVLYCYDYLGKIRGFDVEGNVWKDVKGLDKELPKFMSGAAMADVGGRLFVVWMERKGNGKGLEKEMEVLGAEVEVVKDGDGELKGSVSLLGTVVVVPDGSLIMNCLAVVF